MNHRYLLFLLVLPIALRVSAQPLNPKPVRELGAPRLIATQANPLAIDTASPNYVEGKELFNPSSVALDYSSNPPSVYITDTGNNRVLGWRYATQLQAGARADIVLGQKDFFTTLPQATNAVSLNSPSGIAVDSAGNVYIADSGNNRIIRFPKPFTQTNGPPFPDLVLGQLGFTAGSANPLGVTAGSLALGNGAFPPQVGMAFDSNGDLYVSDTFNNRVLRYNAAALSSSQPPNGTGADLVLGQSNLTTNTPLTGNGSQLNKTGLNGPEGLAFDSTGRLYVTDRIGRVLVYATLTTGAPATRLLGVAPIAPVVAPPPPPPNSPTVIPLPTGQYVFGNALGVAIAAGHPVVTDSGANRILVFDVFENWAAESVTNVSPPAILLIGQANYTQSAPNNGLTAPSAATLSVPYGATASATELFVADANNNRVLAFPLAGGIPATSASRVIGQLATTLNAPNLIEGREFNLFNGSTQGSIAIDASSNPPHLYVADTGNNRILGFNDYLHVKAGDTADLVIGQQNLLTSAVNYPSNDATKLSANTLSAPTALLVDAAGNLYVADTGNARVLRFPQPFGPKSARTQASADLVVGQQNFNVKVTDTTNRTMRAPTGIALASDGSLLVSDAALNRVLYFPKPLASGMVATKVIGQSDFNVVEPLPAAGTPITSLNPARLNSPRQIATDPQDRLYVCDVNNARVAVFDTVGNLNPTLAQPALQLTTNLAQPIGITIAPAGSPAAGQIWVSDFQSGALHYGGFSQLLLNTAPDITVAANHALSAAFDSFGGLALADGTNRVLQFVPQLTITNGATFQSGSVAPGTIISVFPAQATTTAPLAAAGTSVSYNSLPNPVPLPSVLGGSQVTVNGQPAPLFYVSATQINLALPTNLPISGSLDLEITSPSTGQIFGLTEINMAPVSPGLFSLAGTGTGPLAALNANGTVNSPANPLLRGGIIVLFGTGEGPVPNAPPDGTPASGPTPTATQPVVVFGQGDNIIQAAASDLQYSGLAPGLIGVWQINVRVPTTVTAGNQVPVVVYVQSVPTNGAGISTTIALQ